MTQTWLLLTYEISLISCALVAGVFLTFSDFVMRSLNGATTSAGVEVMQGINREVFKTIFMVLLIGMWGVSAALGVAAYLGVLGSGSTYILWAAITYSVGVASVTLVFNVPMNTKLAMKAYDSPEGAAYWTDVYYPRWTFWNWVRGIASAVAAVLYLNACLQLVQG
ncbi:MAG: DUF1772 domain-containing protein [Parvibaculaceae bacterium]|nr:DUF1772 domain-containing protein [Parvibaculaceae bacterium]HBM87152.1 DUF1772 domain-containing protein [Rhodobiaceae bacterium]|tara:strand:+ start:951 stop:1448 length:498 start_codon:yes stop_codon:yes gene_type:complete